MITEQELAMMTETEIIAYIIKMSSFYNLMTEITNSSEQFQSNKIFYLKNDNFTIEHQNIKNDD